MMYKYSLLLLSTLSILQANVSEFSLENQASFKKEYFVKLGAFSQSENSQKILEETAYANRILFLGKYYSVVSEGYDNKEDAEKRLLSIKSSHPDAYIITLYKKPKIEVLEESAPSAYQIAVSYYHDKQYEEALAGFDRVLIEDEDNINAKVYYAKTLFKLGITDEAKKVLKSILETDLNREQKRQIEKFLEVIEEKTKRHFFTTTLSFGVGYDDNINLTTDALQTEYGGLTLINDINKSTSSYGLATLLLSHRYGGDSFDIVTSLHSYNEFAHTETGNNLNYLNLSTGILKSINNWSLMLPIGINSSYLDGSHIGYNIYTNPTISYNLSKNMKSYIQASYVDNSTKFMAGRDYTMIGAHAGLTYAQRKYKVGIQVGVADVNQKEDLRFDVEKDILSAALFGKYFIFTKSFIAANVALTQDRYSILDITMGYKREDDILNMGLSLGKYVGENGLVEVKYLHRENDSNVNAYAYDKNIYTLEYKYKF